MALTAVLDWVRGQRERRGRRALAARLRRDLVDDEAALARAAAVYEAATREALAADPRHAALAAETRRLAHATFDLARRRVSLHAGTLRTIEAELSED